MTNLFEQTQSKVADLVFFSNAFSYAHQNYINECDKPSLDYDHNKAQDSFDSALTHCRLALGICEDLGFDASKVLSDCVYFQEAYNKHFKIK